MIYYIAVLFVCSNHVSEFFMSMMLLCMHGRVGHNVDNRLESNHCIINYLLKKAGYCAHKYSFHTPKRGHRTNIVSFLVLKLGVR